MGRVAKYKKIKACDPFSKRSAKDSNNLSAGGVLLDPRKRRGSKFEKRMRKHLKRNGGKGRRGGNNNDIGDFEKNNGFDCPPPEEDDFDINDPFLTVKAKKNPKGNDVTGDADVFGAHPVVSLPDGHAAVSLDEELKTARLLNISSRPTSSQRLLKKGIIEGRKEGESIHDYRRRANDETRQLKKDIVRDEKKASSSVVNSGEGTKHEKRKDYLKNKRRKKNAGRRMAFEAKMANNNKRRLDDDDDDDNDGFVSGDVAKSLSAPLGDQVERPPMFAMLPRGAKAKKNAKINSGGRGTVMDDAQREKEQNALEIMRQKAVERYALMKAKRRKAGDFHL